MQLSQDQEQRCKKMYRDILQKLQTANVSGDSEIIHRWELQKILDDDIYRELCASGLFTGDSVILSDVAFFLAAADEAEERFFFQELSRQTRREVLLLSTETRALSPLKKAQNGSKNTFSNSSRSSLHHRSSFSSSPHNAPGPHGRHLQQKVQLLERQQVQLTEEAAQVRARRKSTQLRTEQLQNELLAHKNAFLAIKDRNRIEGLTEADSMGRILPTEDLSRLLSALQQQQEQQVDQLRSEVCVTLPKVLDCELTSLFTHLDRYRGELEDVRKAAEELRGEGVAKIIQAGMSQAGVSGLTCSGVAQRLGQSQAAAAAQATQVAQALTGLQEKLIAASEAAAQLSRLVQMSLQNLYADFGQARVALDKQLDHILAELARDRIRNDAKKQNTLTNFLIFGIIFLQLIIFAKIYIRLRV